MNTHASLRVILTAIALTFGSAAALAQTPRTLPGTKPLTMEGDIASQMIDGVDKFLLRKLDESVALRASYWKRDFSSAEAYAKSIEPNRKHLAHILGVRDPRVPFDAPQLVATTDRPALVGKGKGFDVYAVRWPVLAHPREDLQLVSIHGEGLLLVPTGGAPVADVIAIPDCEQTPEQIAGLAEGVAPESQFARRLAEAGCRVLVPTLINRSEAMPKLSFREYLYRPAFELGRHLIGYEVQKVLAGVDWFEKSAKSQAAGRRIGVVGYGEGGLLAQYAAALDTRIDVALVSGYFDARQNLWQEPIDRNVFQLLREFGDAEVASLVAPRELIVEVCKGPTIAVPGGRGAPSRTVSPTTASVNAEAQRAREMVQNAVAPKWLDVAISDDGSGSFCGSDALAAFVTRLSADANVPALADAPRAVGAAVDAAARHTRQAQELLRHNEAMLDEAEVVRTAFLKKLYDAVPKGVDEYNKVAAEYRSVFRNDVIGSFDDKRLPFNPRTRLDAETDRWTRYEVVLDVFPDVFAYGLLIVPKHMKDSEKRPVVVCQHGLEGRPQSVIGDEQKQYYKAFATELAERGFITFAPQNIYIFQDRFRTLQRKANPLGKTLFSIMVPQHQQITDWLKTLPGVDGNRIGFYGLSYGGKSAMRIPALVDNYCLSICSADFNEWVWKNATTSTFGKGYSYANKNEYEIFEWDLGSTFNYAEMAAIIAPRPFMVERGHDDGVAPDETVAYEYAKIRRLYDKLGIGDRTTIEFFNGPHSIHGVGTYEFLHKHLNWPAPK